ncbi:hypothetical protein LTR62_001259 [Meristemomyces frigidus]|uniref:Rho-GAP domain-containing protein n=1 Tax=Meristemomyces frigidus TaxID=1508187 RepID=A0AAN7YBV8_9PEZI|nr:hypothetical protein LTR62_001259 [Meristemomyces frigidus]
MQGVAISASSRTVIMPPNKTRPTDLTINLKSAAEAAQSSAGPHSSPIILEGVDLSSFGEDIGPGSSAPPPSLPPLPHSPSSSPRHNREISKNILRQLGHKSSKAEQGRAGGQVRQVKDEQDAYRPTNSSSMAAVYQLKKNVGSSPELSLVGSTENIVRDSEDVNGVNDSAEVGQRPQAAPHHSEDSAKRTGNPFRKQLGRSKSTRSNSNDSRSRPERAEPRTNVEPPLRTAPLPTEQAMKLLGRKDKDKDKKRGKSVERPGHSESDENITQPARPVIREKEKDREKDKGGFMSSSKNAVSKTTKASGNFLTRLGKIGRSSSHNDKEVPDSEYVLKVINLPLVEQTRITRISKDLNGCRDKTEYWMPSLPWRCIDYLNLNCEAEGLYRVPGSGPQVKRWQRRFDTEHDVDLLDETELYDPNNIGSMLKSWLRDLPTEIMPNHLQLALGAQLEKENPDYAKIGQPAPQKLRDALSELPPFNYYLLFAITCHLSLLLSHKDRNRMDLNNLSICIGPCLRLERWLFNYLVGDWRHCWQGCYTEKEALEIEKAYEQGSEYRPPKTALSSHSVINGGAPGSSQGSDDRAVHSSDSEQTNQQADTMSTLSGGSMQIRGENSKPDTYRPFAAREPSNSSMFAPQQRNLAGTTEMKRPATAEDGKGSEDASPRGTSQRYTHSRSRSDIVTTPVQNDFTLPPLPTRPT